MPWFRHNGVGLHWREDGDPSGPPVLLLNSLGTDLRLWDGVLPNLSGHRVIRMDTRGHGLSDAPGGPYDLVALTTDALGLVRHLGVARLSVIGVSLGGMMAQFMAATAPDLVDRVVLSNTAPRMGTQQLWADRTRAVNADGLDSIADAILERWFAPAFRTDDTIGLWRNMLTRTPDLGYMGCCAALADADLGDIVPQIACPALVIAGAEDGASPPDLVRPLAAAIPDARYHEMAGVGHLPMIEAPDSFAALVRDFLKEPAHA
ncbi:MAG: 3-oxoadipate enol-lactonase [Pseudomonadota bacterium]